MNRGLRAIRERRRRDAEPANAWIAQPQPYARRGRTRGRNPERNEHEQEWENAMRLVGGVFVAALVVFGIWYVRKKEREAERERVGMRGRGRGRDRFGAGLRGRSRSRGRRKRREWDDDDEEDGTVVGSLADGGFDDWEQVRRRARSRACRRYNDRDEESEACQEVVEPTQPAGWESDDDTLLSGSRVGGRFRDRDGISVDI